ncbi:serine protease [Chloroflexota bacterium]
MSWVSIYKKVLPYIVSIQTPEGSGTGFLFTYNEGKTIAGIATAAHVVKYADDWKLPIKIIHFETKTEIFLTDDKRVIYISESLDSASILLFSKDNSILPKDTLPLMDPEKFINVGVEVGWVGFPSISSSNLCFFTGPISARLKDYNSYLIDGVAINGVSGGPVFYASKDDSRKLKPKIVGAVTAYRPNRLRGDTLPGLLQAQDLTAFYETIKTLKSYDDAKNKKLEQERKKQEESPTSTVHEAKSK